MKKLLPVFFALVFLYACTNQEGAPVRHELLFTLEYGEDERQLNLFASPTDVPVATKDRVIIYEGIFYIANGNARKVMLFNSYGDLLNLFYNPETTRQPVSLLPRSAAEGRITTLSAYQIPFQAVGEIAISSKKQLMVEDLVSLQQAVYDEESGSMLNRVITRISNTGEKLDYLGQEGIGGTPFPYIHSLWTTQHDYVVVVTRTMNFWHVYGYNDGGDKLYDVVFYLDSLPVIDQDNIVVLNTIVPSRDSAKLYLMLSYYQEGHDPDTNASFAMEFVASRIYTLDIVEQKYTTYIDIPQDEQYELVGVSNKDNFFIVSLIEAEKSKLLVINKDGKVLTRKTLLHQPYLYRSLSVSTTGDIASMFIHETGADVVLWRVGEE